MKKFVFTLENVLRFKTESLDMLKNEMVQIQMQIRKLEGEIARLRREFSDLNLKLAVQMRAGLETRDVAVYKGYFAELDRCERKLEARRAAAQRAAAAKQEEIVRMKSDISGLEKLREGQLKEYEAQDRKEQEQMVEEFVSHQKSTEDFRTA